MLEKDGQKALRELMHRNGWHTEKIAGSAFVIGLPDLYCMHPTIGTRWIEMKKKNGKLSEVQIKKFITWAKYGVQVWVLTGPEDYPLLFKTSNLHLWLTK